MHPVRILHLLIATIAIVARRSAALPTENTNGIDTVSAADDVDTNGPALNVLNTASMNIPDVASNVQCLYQSHLTGWTTYRIFNVQGDEATLLQAEISQCGVVWHQEQYQSDGLVYVTGRIPWTRHDNCLDHVLLRRYGIQCDKE